jgi:hypothetical protein
MTMADVDIAFLLNLFVLLIQTLCSCQPTVGSNDDITLELVAAANMAMDSHDSHIALCVVALHDYVFQLGSFALTTICVIGLNLDARCGSANF